MSEQKQRGGSGGVGMGFRNAMFLVIVGLCIFGAPYLVYALTQLLKLEWFVSWASGFVLFAIGLALVGYLIKKRVVS
jgi:hypothetical protein